MKIYCCLAIIIFGGYGFIANIISLSKCDFESPYKEEVIRSVGVFIPVIGIVSGYINFENQE